MEPFIAQIQAFGFNFAPRGWNECNGALLAISSNPALFSLLGTTYGGDGRATFAVPDLRGRNIVGQGHGPALSPRKAGEKFGSETHQLNHCELPTNAILADLSGVTGVLSAAANDAIVESYLPESQLALRQHHKTKNNAFSPVSRQGENYREKVKQTARPDNYCTGDGAAFNIMPPCQVTNYSIALLGIFPTRN